MKTHRIKRVLLALLLGANTNVFYAMEKAETFEDIITKAMNHFESDDFPTLPADLIAQCRDPNIQLLDRICREKNPALAEQFLTIEAESQQARHANFTTAFSQYNAFLWLHMPPSDYAIQDRLEDAVADILALLKQYNYPTLPDDAVWELSTENLKILDKICFERNPDAAQEFFVVPCINELERFKNIGFEYNRYVALLSKYNQAPSDLASLPSPINAEQRNETPSPAQEMKDQFPWVHTCDVTDTEIRFTITRNPLYQDPK